MLNYEDNYNIDIERMNDEELNQLRNEIVLNSLYLSDYINSFGIDAERTCDFFDGYSEYISELMVEDGISESGFDDNYWKHLKEYDTIETLSEYYNYIVESPFGY